MPDGEFGYHDLERAALGFALEDHIWPLFLSWMAVNHISAAAHQFIVTAELATVREQFMQHSPDPVVRALAGGDNAEVS